ncbi:hypothetical protein Q3G72_015774 [Acer saccharum]|nr:hypothetical protein Q3G72_015774 [Acer saccharum]
MGTWKATDDLRSGGGQTMEVRLKIIFTSLCHTDVYFWEAKLRPKIYLEEDNGFFLNIINLVEDAVDLIKNNFVTTLLSGQDQFTWPSSESLVDAADNSSNSLTPKGHTEDESSESSSVEETRISVAKNVKDSIKKCYHLSCSSVDRK